MVELRYGEVLCEGSEGAGLDPVEFNGGSGNLA